MEQQQIKFEDLEDIKLDVLQEMFNIFDFSGTGHIFTDDLGCILRGLGFNVSEQTLSELINKYDKEGRGQVRFHVLYMMIRDSGPFPRILTPQEVIDRLSYFDVQNTGKLHTSKCAEIFCNMAEGISVEDAKQLLSEVEVDGDSMINIRDFVEYLQASSIDCDL